MYCVQKKNIYEYKYVHVKFIKNAAIGLTIACE